MSNKIAKKKHVNQTFAAKINHVIRIIIRVALTVYVSLLIVVMPFYNTDGYARIGTNKFSFFKFWTVPAIYLLLPLCIIYGFFYLVDRITSSSNRQPNTKKNKNIFTILRLNLHKKPNAISHQESNGLLHEKNTVKPTVRQHAILDINAKDLKHGILCGLSLTDIGAIVFGVSVLLSYLLTANRQEALWGATGWYMGCITQLALVGLYFLISRFWKVSPWMIGLFLPVSALVFLFGLLNRFGIDPLSMDINNPVYISTIGNINWYCGYLVPIFFACATFIWQRKWGNPLVRILLWSYVGLGFATLVTHGSSSGIVALGVMLVVWYGLSGLPARENDGRQLVSF
ncbi:MAG: hypothetical protein LBM60_02050, partial [Clostridium sp.]|nr:hypothetical protein [Clostridium sp.]